MLRGQQVVECVLLGVRIGAGCSDGFECPVNLPVEVPLGGGVDRLRAILVGISRGFQIGSPRRFTALISGLDFAHGVGDDPTHRGVARCFSIAGGGKSLVTPGVSYPVASQCR